jgi:membrane-associated protease RseP (regulator of RpoE activity)
MRKRTITFALIAAVAGATGIVAAAPKDQKPSDTSTSTPRGPDDPDDVQVTVRAGHGRLGFAALQISPELRKHLGAPGDRGVLVDNVRPDSPAARAGLRAGDVLVEVDAKAVHSATDVIDAISDRKKGDTVTLAVTRGKDHVTLQATLADDPGPRLQGFDDSSWERFGTGQFPFEMKQLFGDQNMRRALEDAKQRMDQLERRIESLEGRSGKPKLPGQSST